MKDEKIKICIASIYAYHLFFPDKDIKGRVGGAEMQLYNFAIKLAEDSKFEIHFFVGNFCKEKKQKVKNVYVYPIFKISKLKIIFNTIKLYRILLKINFDIAVQRASGIETGIMALFSKIFSKKLVYMVAHDQDVLKKRPSYLKNNFFQIIRWKLYKFGLKRADLVFVQNEYQREELLKNYNKSSILRNNAHFLNSINNNNIFNREYILWIGRADKQFKQPEIFINLAEELKTYKFIMICQESSDKKYFNEIRNKAEKVNNLEFIDYVPIQGIDNYFAKSIALVNTSLQEGFPNTFIEAFKNKTLVLSLNVNPNDIFKDNNLGFFADGDVLKLKDFLLTGLKNKNLLVKIINNAYDYMREEFDINRITTQDREYLIKLWR